MAKIILGITGSIAAYKGADITNELMKKGHMVKVAMTPAAQKFITPLTLESLSGNKVYTDMFREEAEGITHVTWADSDLFVIAPATANIMAKLVTGFADCPVSALGLTTYKLPRLIAPAMNTRMYQHPATQKNLEILSGQGYELIEPRTARLACGETGQGALATVTDIIIAIERRLLLMS